MTKSVIPLMKCTVSERSVNRKIAKYLSHVRREKKVPLETRFTRRVAHWQDVEVPWIHAACGSIGVELRYKDGIKSC